LPEGAAGKHEPREGYAVRLGIPGCVDEVLIGRGGFGSVYRCRQEDLNRTVAVKVFNLSQAAAEDIAAFERECAAVGQLGWYPNIVTVFQTGRTVDGDPFLIMEFAPEGSLRDRIEQSGPLDESATRRIASRIAGALAVVHAAGMLHRDVKPANILFSQAGEPMLADFGIAKLAEGTLPTAGMSMSVAYAAPEVLMGEPASAASDIYSLGATMYTLLAGHAPFASSSKDTTSQVIVRTLTGPEPDVAALRVSDDLSSILRRCLQRNPAARFATAQDLVKALAVSQSQKATALMGVPVTRRWPDAFYAPPVHAPVTLTVVPQVTRWPTALDYVDGIQSYALSGLDQQFGSVKIARDAMGMPATASGQTVVVFELSSNAGPLALRCYTRAPGDGGIRYRELADYMAKVRCDAVVPAIWCDSVICANNATWPAVVMPWVTGVPLNVAVEDMLDRPEELRALADAWTACMTDLATARIAHGDLQCGNVLVDKAGQIQLIDLDGVYVPTLRNPPDEFGHPNFQHPKRTVATWGPDVDAFSAVVVGLSLRALAEDPQLWRFNSGENLIFSKEDYLTPGYTELWEHLLGSSQLQVRNLAKYLYDCCCSPSPPTLRAALFQLGADLPAADPIKLPAQLDDQLGMTILRPASKSSQVTPPLEAPDEQWWDDPNIWAPQTSQARPQAASQTLQDVGTMAATVPRASFDAPSRAATLSAPTATLEARGIGRFILKNSAVTAIIASLIAAVIALLIFGAADPPLLYRAVVLIGLVGALFAGCLACLPRLAMQAWESAFKNGFLGAILGLALSLGALGLFELIFFGTDSLNAAAPVLFAWSAVGFAVGLATGIVRLSSRAVGGGILGGVVGGVLGGWIYLLSKPSVVELTDGHALELRVDTAMVVAVIVACATIGLAIGVADRITRRASLTVIEGPMRGSQISLDRRSSSLGSSFTSTLRLNDDPSVMETHAVIEIDETAQVVVMAPIEVQGVAYPAGATVPLSSGDVLRVGGSFIRFTMQARP